MARITWLEWSKKENPTNLYESLVDLVQLIHARTSLDLGFQFREKHSVVWGLLGASYVFLEGRERRFCSNLHV